MHIGVLHSRQKSWSVVSSCHPEIAVLAAHVATIMSDFHHSAHEYSVDPSSISTASSFHHHNQDISVNGFPSNAGHWFPPIGHVSMEESKAAPRRRRQSGNDQIKHRRTRNGCYTCRSRRVKVSPARFCCDQLPLALISDIRPVR